MGRKKGNVVVDLIVGLFQIAFALASFAVLAVVGLVKLFGSVSGGKKSSGTPPGNPEANAPSRPTFADFHHTGATKEESFSNYLAALGVPPKPKFKQFSHSGSTYEESQENFLNALQEWRDKYEVTVYGSRWEDDHDDADDE